MGEVSKKVRDAIMSAEGELDACDNPKHADVRTLISHIRAEPARMAAAVAAESARCREEFGYVLAETDAVGAAVDDPRSREAWRECASYVGALLDYRIPKKPTTPPAPTPVGATPAAEAGVCEASKRLRRYAATSANEPACYYGGALSTQDLRLVLDALDARAASAVPVVAREAGKRRRNYCRAEWTFALARGLHEVAVAMREEADALDAWLRATAGAEGAC